MRDWEREWYNLGWTTSIECHKINLKNWKKTLVNIELISEYGKNSKYKEVEKCLGKVDIQTIYVIHGKEKQC